MKKNKLIDCVVYLWSKKPDRYKEVRKCIMMNTVNLFREEHLNITYIFKNDNKHYLKRCI